MVKVAVIEDETLAVAVLERYLADYPDYTIVSVSGNGFDGLKAIRELKPDLVFLDVQMPRISGFEMLELIDEPPAVIFTTAYDEYALRAFEANALDYLLKPFSPERFARAIKKFEETRGTVGPDLSGLQGREEDNSRIVVKKGSEIIIIPVNEVSYIEAYDDYVKIYSGDNRFVKKKTLAFYENSLERSGFVRVHRSYLINSSEIAKMEVFNKDQHLVILKDGSRIPCSRSGYQKLKEGLSL